MLQSSNNGIKLLVIGGLEPPNLSLLESHSTSMRSPKVGRAKIRVEYNLFFIASKALFLAFV